MFLKENACPSNSHLPPAPCLYLELLGQRPPESTGALVSHTPLPTSLAHLADGHLLRIGPRQRLSALSLAEGAKPGSEAALRTPKSGSQTHVSAHAGVASTLPHGQEAGALALPLTHCVALGKLPSLSVPQFLPWSDGDSVGLLHRVLFRSQ